MKTPAFLSFFRLPSAVLLMAGTLGLTQIAEARPDHRSGRGHRSGHSHYSKNHHHHRGDHHRGAYMRHPRSGFSLSFGTGYAGSGYYYGPAGSSYYYQRPGVGYYRTRAAVPRAYWSSPGYAAGPRYSYHRSGWSDVHRCQAALSRMGYYRGPIDGSLGPGSRAAIRRYQLRRGMPATGYADHRLMISLGIR